MKHNTYIVAFVTGEAITVYAFNKQAATILGQADQILKGNDYTVKEISEVD